MHLLVSYFNITYRFQFNVTFWKSAFYFEIVWKIFKPNNTDFVWTKTLQNKTFLTKISVWFLSWGI